MERVVLSAATRVFMRYALPHDREGYEKAYVTVNGKMCSIKSFATSTGSAVCGNVQGTTNDWFEDSVAVRCDAESVNGEVTVRVYTNLGGGAHEESFAIDNVKLSMIPAGKDTSC